MKCLDKWVYEFYVPQRTSYFVDFFLRSQYEFIDSFIFGSSGVVVCRGFFSVDFLIAKQYFASLT